MPKPTPEEFLAALDVIKEYDDGFFKEADLPLDVQMRGVMKAIRMLVRTPEGESCLYRVATVIRRHDMMAKELGRDYP